MHEKKKNEKFTIMCSRFPQNLEFPRLRLFSFVLDVTEMYQNVLRTCKAIVHTQSYFCGVSVALAVVVSLLKFPFLICDIGSKPKGVSIQFLSHVSL